MLSILEHQTSLPSLAIELRLRAEIILKELKLDLDEVSVLLCDDNEIQELNKEWRGIDKSTDVLSFPQSQENEFFYPEGEEEMEKQPSILGDIVISVDTCMRQAEELGHSSLDEATRLWIHGLLHLCGYDHENLEDAKEMLKKEEDVIALLEDGEGVIPLVSL